MRRRNLSGRNLSGKRQPTPEPPKPAADTALELLLDQHVRPVVAPAIFSQILARVNEVAKVHYGRGYKRGAEDSW